MVKKFSELPLIENGKDAYAYYCVLCEEILILSEQEINPRKIILALNDKCPDCGFKLTNVLRCEISKVDAEKDQLDNSNIVDPLLTHAKKREKLRIGKANSLQATSESNLTSGSDSLDSKLALRLGHLIALHGKAAHKFSSLLCVRATVPPPLGPDSDVVFLDGGNIFDAYSISEHAVRHALDPVKTITRMHISRAFTYHQLSTLINEKLLQDMKRFNSKIVIVSDITQLYCDPDVARQEKRAALDAFQQDVKALAILAEKRRATIIVTNLHARDNGMETSLLRTAHVSARLEDYGCFIQLTLVKHPFIPQLKARISLNKETLESYL